MKKHVLRILASFVTVVFVFTSCIKNDEGVKLDPTLATSKVEKVTSDGATVYGFVIAEGDGFTERGVCYGVAENPTVDGDKVVYSDTTASSDAEFIVVLTGLDYATTYYARAYATGASETVYGEQVNFTTLPVVPTLTTAEITDITGSSATGGGSVTIEGGAEIIRYGICYDTTAQPTVESHITEEDEGITDFVSELTDLLGGATYYVRAYAENSAGVGYGPQVTFNTPITLPIITTDSIKDLTKSSLTTGGNVVHDGGAAVTEKGVVWALSANPTTADFKKKGGIGAGPFTSKLGGLLENTTYYIRAYAINSLGTAYGNEWVVTTLADITKFFVVGDYNGWDNSEAAKIILSTTESAGMAEGYVYLTTGGIKLTTDHSWDDAHTFGDDGSGGLTNPGNNIPVDEDGYYRIRASLFDMSYSLVKTEWGVIGSATPNQWDDETPLTYDADSDTWIGGIHLTEAEIKFRANHDWAYNYGSTAGDETLDADGTNIAIGFEADYAITLDLSTPNEYTYTANYWGLIGSATPGGWDTDTDMTWDATNEVFTVTLELVVGEYKFRANDEWTINFGGSLDGLTQDGSNLAVTEDGNYTVTLDPWAGTGSITKN